MMKHFIEVKPDEAFVTITVDDGEFAVSGKLTPNEARQIGLRLLGEAARIDRPTTVCPEGNYGIVGTKPPPLAVKALNIPRATDCRTRGNTEAHASADYLYEVDGEGVITAVVKAKNPDMAQRVGEAFEDRRPGDIADVDGNIWLSHDEKAKAGRLMVTDAQARIARDYEWQTVGGGAGGGQPAFTIIERK